MMLKAAIGVVIFAGTTVAALQDDPTNQTPTPTSADVQQLVEIISSDKSKLRAYCDLAAGRRLVDWHWCAGSSYFISCWSGDAEPDVGRLKGACRFFWAPHTRCYSSGR